MVPPEVYNIFSARRASTVAAAWSSLYCHVPADTTGISTPFARRTWRAPRRAPDGSVQSGSWKCALMGVLWQEVGFSTISLGWFALRQTAESESAEHAETPGQTYEGAQTTACVKHAACRC